MKTKHKIMLIIFLIISLISGIVVDSFYFAPSRFKIRYETLSSPYIPLQLDNVSITYFSDVHYNNFMDKPRFQKVISLINQSGGDIVIFGGDLFDNPSTALPSDEVIVTLTEQLKSINAPLGKFAVLGSHDYQSEEAKKLVMQILRDADFEVLMNQSVSIHNKGSHFVNLVGIDSLESGSADCEQAYRNVSPYSYTIAVCYTPDIINSVPKDLTNIVLSGNTHGGQALLPFVSNLVEAPYASLYQRGKHDVEGVILDITNGVGTTKKDVRLFAPAEIVSYKLSSKINDEAS